MGIRIGLCRPQADYVTTHTSGRAAGIGAGCDAGSGEPASAIAVATMRDARADIEHGACGRGRYCSCRGNRCCSTNRRISRLICLRTPHPPIANCAQPADCCALMKYCPGRWILSVQRVLQVWTRPICLRKIWRGRGTHEQERSTKSHCSTHQPTPPGFSSNRQRLFPALAVGFLCRANF